MKRQFLLTCFSLLMVWGCFSSGGPQPLTLTTTIPTSESAATPPAVEPTNIIVLEFSEPLNINTVEGNVSLHAVKSDGQPAAIEPPLRIASDAQNPGRLLIETQNSVNLPSGEAYKLVVRTGIQSIHGKTLRKDFVGYFATVYPLTLGTQTIPELGDARTIILVVSDIHMGDARSIAGGYAWFNNNRTKLVRFLDLVRPMPNVRELVIAGDLFDEWVAPMVTEPFNGLSQSEFVDGIVSANQSIVDAINNIIKDGLIEVTYVPGNHDMLAESGDIQRIFPGMSEARDARGLGAYMPLDQPEIVIEHGHRYDFFNAPDPISNRSITKTASILPPGFFVSKIATTSDLERGQPRFIGKELADRGVDRQHYLSYWAAWQLIMFQKPVKASWRDKIIKTGIDGYADAYAIDDLIPYHPTNDDPLDVNLYKGITDTWGVRQKENNVAVPITAEAAMMAVAYPVMDALAAEQYFLNPSSNKRIVVFGHTHKAEAFNLVNHELKGTVYANSGTWIDHENPTTTFVSIIPQKNDKAVAYTVTAYQYADGATPKKISSAVITTIPESVRP